MNIMVVGVCDLPQSTNTFMVKALRDNGHWVSVYNYRTMLGLYKDNAVQKMNEDLMRMINDCRGRDDLIIFCKTDTVLPETINFASQITKTYYWFMDPLITARGMRADLLAKEAHFCSATSDECVEYFKQNGCFNVTKIREGFDPTVYKLEKPLAYVPKVRDVVFIGSADRQRVEALNHISYHPEITYDIFGENWPEHLRVHPPVYNEDLAKVIKESRIVLNFVRGNIISDRVIVTLACGGFLLSEAPDDMLRAFVPNMHFVRFKDNESMLEKIKQYTCLDSDIYRTQIAETGQKYVHENYTWQKVCKKLTDFVEGKLDG